MRRSQRRGHRWSTYSVVQHMPSSMDNTVLTGDQLVTLIAVPNVNAGGAIGTDRTNEDRQTKVANGRHIGHTTVNIDWLPSVGSAGGILEYIVWKLERQPNTPIVGIFPVPTDPNVQNQGMQQAYRIKAPGWVIQYGQRPFTLETQKTAVIKINWSKFKKDTMRDGDFFGITYFNRSDSSINLNVQMRYKTYG